MIHIYTKMGDQGITSLANGHRISKANAIIEAYGTADELNAAVGLLRANYDCNELNWIQHRLFDLGAALAQAPLHLTTQDIEQLELWIDSYQTMLPILQDFILPSGSESICRCHMCRTITRRLERTIVACQDQDTWKNELIFVNRLSDYFFVLARYLALNNGEKEEKWQKK